MLTRNYWTSFLVLTFGFFSLSSCDFFSQRLYYKPLVKVEENELSLQEFSKKLAAKLKDLDPLSAKDPNIVKKFKDQLVSDFVVDQLIRIWFNESGFTLEQDVVNKRVQNYIAGYPNDTAFRSALAEENLSFNEWESSIKVAMMREYLFESLRNKTDSISEEEVKNYYEQNKARFFQKESVQVRSILLKDESQSDVIKKLYKKTPFETLVADYSIENPKPKEGLYGWIERDSIADVDTLFTNKKNELVGPFRFNDGYRLFKVISRKPSHYKTQDEVKSQIEKEILSLRETARFSAWLDEQIKRYKIYKNAQAIDAIAVETREE